MINKFIRKEMKMGKNMSYDDYLVEEHWRMSNDGWVSFLISDVIRMEGCGSNTMYYMMGGDEFIMTDTIGESGLKFPGNHMRSDDKGTIINFNHIIMPLELIDGKVSMEEGQFAHVSRRGMKTFLAAFLRFIRRKGIKNIRKKQVSKKKKP
jgi:hypothetical protein